MERISDVKRAREDVAAAVRFLRDQTAALLTQSRQNPGSTPEPSEYYMTQLYLFRDLLDVVELHDSPF